MIPRGIILPTASKKYISPAEDRRLPGFVNVRRANMSNKSLNNVSKQMAELSTNYHLVGGGHPQRAIAGAAQRTLSGFHSNKQLEEGRRRLFQ